MKIDNSSFERVEEFNYLGTTLTKQNSIQEEINTFAASYLNTQGLNNSFLKSPASTLVDLTFQSRTLRSFSLNQLRNLSLQAGNLHSSFSISS